MKRTSSMLICSALGMVVGASIALAAAPSLPAQVGAAKQSLQTAMMQLQQAQSMNPGDTQMKKAMSYIGMATAELDGMTKPRHLTE